MERAVWSELTRLIVFIQKKYCIITTLFSNLGSVRKKLAFKKG